MEKYLRMVHYMNKKDIKYVIAMLIIVSVFASAIFILKKINDKKDEPINYLKNYGVNEYIPTYVSDENMAKIYLNDYINTMLYDTESAYNLIDEKYKESKFPSYKNYYDYVINLKNYDVKLSSFYKKVSKGYIIFGVYDQYNNFYAFKTKGVMQYKVFLDENTVEIW